MLVEVFSGLGLLILESPKSKVCLASMRFVIGHRMLDFGFGLLTLEFGPWTLDCLLPTADCRLTTLNKLLRFVQPTLVRAILVGRRSLHSFNAGLHRTGGFTPVAKSGMRASHQVKPFRI